MDKKIEHPYLVLSKSVKLNNRERMFIIEYCSNGFRQSAAAEAAGYKPRIFNGRIRMDVVAARVLRKPAVAKAISDFMNRAIQVAKDRLEYQILKYYNTRAFYNPSDIINDEGELIRPLNQMGDLAMCVEGIKVSYHGKDCEVKSKAVQLCDREKALAQLAKYIGMINDVNLHKHVHLNSGNIEIEGKNYDSIEAIDNEILKIEQQLDED